jgi:methionyl aminopeptidase
MIHLKTPAEIQIIRETGHLLGKILQALGKAVEEGKTPIDIEAYAEKLMGEYNATPGFKGYRGYPNICCISVNEKVVHAIPDRTPFKRGDLVTIDCGIVRSGLNTDAAISVIVGGDAAGSDVTRKLNSTTRKALYKGISLVKPGVKIGDLSHAIQQTVESAGFSIIRELTGHGIGYHLHEEPNIPNYGKKGTGPVLKPGMTICIEPIVAAGERFIDTLDNRWTIATRDGSRGCQWEHTLLVTKTGCEILTEAQE